MIDWNDERSHLLLNPRLAADERERLETLHDSVPSLPAHIWLATSGTTGSARLVALSKAAMLASARAVNEHLGAQRSDVWYCVLPQFHVGGLSIDARAFLSGSRVLHGQWDPLAFARGGFTLASLVPAQVVDLVEGQHRAPDGVRAVVVGGGRLAVDLLERAGELGWPLLPSYGLTEAASQVATAGRPGETRLRLLPHLEVEARGGLLWLRGGSLLTGYGQFDERGRAVLVDPKADGWFNSGDRGEVSGGVLTVEGRGADYIKVGGESVDLVRLDAVLDSIRGGADVAIVGMADVRLGHVVELAATTENTRDIVRMFNDRVAPFERIRGVRRVAAIPRTALGKVRRGELARRIGANGSEGLE
jgi:O-succinylbenzoic acid--CoA ligase